MGFRGQALLRPDESERDLAYPDTVERDAAGIPIDERELRPVADHKHRKAELVQLISGNVSVRTAQGIWAVPSGRALWIPPGTSHASQGSGAVVARCVFFEPALVHGFPDQCHLVCVHPLLREIIERLVELGPDGGAPSDRERRLVAVLLDELVAARTEPFHLPLPTDKRLSQIVQHLLDDPASALSVEDWSQRVGASPRTLGRLFQREVGMPLGKWRQQLHVQIAIRELGRGTSVTAIAFDLGYESASAFITMFKRNTGQTPGAWLHGVAAADQDRQPAN